MTIESRNTAGIGTEEIEHSLRALLADIFTLYLKTKTFHWHMSGPHFRDYHLMLDEHGEQLFERTDAVAKRARKLGLTTIRSIGDITRFQRISDNESSNVSPDSMLAVLCEDNRSLRSSMQEKRRAIPGINVVHQRHTP